MDLSKQNLLMIEIDQDLKKIIEQYENGLITSRELCYAIRKIEWKLPAPRVGEIDRNTGLKIESLPTKS
jgi:hypothetical protein